MKKNFGMALVLGLASSCALAEWQPIQQDRDTAIGYEVGGAKRIDGGVVLVEFKRMGIQLKQRGFIVADQFVAMCRESFSPVVFKMQSTVHLDEGEKLRTLRSEKFDPPQQVPSSDKSVAELGARVCKETPH